MRQIALQVRGVTLAIPRMVQDAIRIVEDVPLGDGIVAVMHAEVLQRPIGNVFAAVSAIFIVDVEGEALRGTLREYVGNFVYHEREHRPGPAGFEPDDLVFCLCRGCRKSARKHGHDMIERSVKKQIRFREGPVDCLPDFFRRQMPRFVRSSVSFSTPSST